MTYKEKLLKTISDEKEKIMNSEDVQRYKRSFEITNKIMLDILDDFTKINTITEDDLTYMEEDAVEVIKGIKYLCEINAIQSEDSKSEIKGLLYKLLKLNVTNKVFKDKNFYNLDRKLSEILDDAEILEGDLETNYDKVTKLIEKYHKKELLTAEEAIRFNIEIGEIIAQKHRISENTEKETIDINEIPKEPEDPEEITTLEEIGNNEEKIKELFKEYGYNFEELNKTTKELIIKYVDLEYAKYILSKLSEYKVSDEKLRDYQITIFQILICKEEKETFKKILEFVDNNECTLASLLKYTGIFHEQSKRIVLKGMQKNPDITSRQKDPLGIYLNIKRNHQNFMKNIELYKQCEGNKKITDAILNDAKQVGLCIKHEKLLANLDILRRYEIVKPNEFPKSFTAVSAKYSEYQIDRFIECGLQEYIKQNTYYISKTAHPYKFYKIRRAIDLGMPLFSRRGLKAEYTSDPTLARNKIHGEKSENVNGIYYQHKDIDNGKPAEIIQEEYTEEQYQMNNPRPIDRSYSKSSHYKYSYKFQECNPNYIFSKYGRNTEADAEIVNHLNQIFSLAKESEVEVKDEDYAKTTETTQIKIFDEGKCQTIDGEFPIKVNNETYEFRAFRHPNAIIRISRLKVIKLFSLLNTYTIKGKTIVQLCKNNNNSKDTLVNIILAVVTNDSIISDWEIYYLRNIITSSLNEYLNSERRSRK